MEIISSFHRYSEGVLSYEELCVCVFQYMQHCSLDEKLALDELLVAHFPLFSHQQKALRISAEQLAGLSLGMLVHGLYTIIGPAVHSACFFEYPVSFGDQEYTLRLLRPSFAESEYEELFLREYTLSESLPSSLNRCVHSCVSSSVPFLVYQHPKGISLKEYMQRNSAFDISRVRQLSLQLCNIVAQIHSLLMSHLGIHLDLFLYSAGGIFVIDFGVTARLQSMGSDVSHMRYAAPEQFEQGYLDAKTDVYSLGVLLYRLFTGAFPFGGKSIEEIREWCVHGNRLDLPFPDTIHPDIQSVICKALHVEPMLRYDSARLLKDALCSATSQIGWYIFDRQLFLAIQPRIALTHTLHSGQKKEQDLSDLSFLGDVFPSWHAHDGLILLNSVSAEQFEFEQKTKEEVIAHRPFSFAQFKKLDSLRAYEEMTTLLSSFQSPEELLLGAYVSSSILVQIAKSEAFFTRVLAQEPSYSLWLDAAVFARWHLLDETRSRKMLQKLEELCTSPTDFLQVAQAYLVFFAAEDDVSRLILRYIQSFADADFFAQTQALQEVIHPFSARPELIRWGIRLEEQCPLHGFVIMKETWLLLNVPKRAQKMQQRFRERLQDATQYIIQGFVSFGIPLPSIPEVEEEKLRFVEEGERLMLLAARRKELWQETKDSSFFAQISEIPLEEQAITLAQEQYEQWLREKESSVTIPEQIEATTEKEDTSAEIIPVEDETTAEEEMSQEEAQQAVQKITLQLVGIWMVLILLFVLGFFFIR